MTDIDEDTVSLDLTRYFDKEYCENDMLDGPDSENTGNAKTCPICSKTFPPKTNLSFHLMLHPCSDKPYSCDHCIYVSMNKEDLFQHCKTEHPYKGNLTCPVCKKVFTNIRTLNKHKPIHAVVLPFKCMYCDRGFAEHVIWRNHELQHKNGRFQCANCKVTFTTFTVYSSHCAEGTCQTDKLECCQETFSTRMNYVEHCIKHHRQNKNLVEISCEFCGRIFGFKHKLNRHLLQCRLRNKPPNGKPECVAPISPAWETYIPNSVPKPVVVKTKTDIRKLHQCDMCDKSFKIKTWLNIHRLKHTEPNLRRYKCKKCECSYTTPSSLSDHNRRRHLKVRPHGCSYCPKRFLTKQDLKDHVIVHTGERPFVCSYCPKTFTSRASRNEHIRFHTGERPYKCQFCPMTFVRLHTKTSHERRHTGEKRFKCCVCDRCFTQHSTWRCHEKRHNSPYRCSECDHVFTSLYTLRNHKKNHVQEVVEADQILGFQVLSNQAIEMSTDGEGTVYIQYQET